jgi:hypothetical protein
MGFFYNFLNGFFFFFCRSLSFISLADTLVLTNKPNILIKETNLQHLMSIFEVLLQHSMSTNSLSFFFPFFFFFFCPFPLLSRQLRPPFFFFSFISLADTLILINKPDILIKETSHQHSMSIFDVLLQHSMSTNCIQCVPLICKPLRH